MTDTMPPAVLPRGDAHFDQYEMEGLVHGQNGNTRSSPRKSPTKIKWLIGLLAMIAIGIVIYSGDVQTFAKSVVTESKEHVPETPRPDNGITDEIDVGNTDEGSDMVIAEDDDYNYDDDDEFDDDDGDDDYDDEGEDGNEGENNEDFTTVPATGDDSEAGDDEDAIDSNTNVDEEIKPDDKSDGRSEADDDFKAFILTEEEEEAKKESLIEQWGKWHFWDGAESTRPTEDYMAEFPNRDCPFDGFPYTAWQADAVYVNHMIDSAGELVERAKEAIYTEYGFGPREAITDEQYSTRMYMFKPDFVDLESDDVTESTNSARGGWTTKKSFKGVARRLLHAMMTNDDFTIVLAGDSSAAGLGNHFLQSYMMQFHNIMEPIMERLGVKLITRNLANGAVGTLPDGLGSGSIHGDKVDMIVWDSEFADDYDNKAAADLFFRQALLSGDRPPALVAPPALLDVLKDLHNNADAEVFALGSGMEDIPLTFSDEQAKTLPLAARYLKCAESAEHICEKKKFNARCWIDRDDVTPPTEQRMTPGDQTEDHPGFREHRLKGRVFASLILKLLADALDEWSEVTIIEGHPLSDDHWHITDYYDNILSKVKNLDESIGSCGNLKEFLPERVCSTPLQARTEVTPRADPSNSSILSILKPAADGSLPSLTEEMLYDGPDVLNPSLMVQEGETDVRAIVMNRRRELFAWREDFDYNFGGRKHEEERANTIHPHIRRRRLDDGIETGEGWELRTLPGTCDGTATGICGRLPSSDCLLYGHMSSEGGLLGNESSGWLVMNMPNMTEGIIMLKFHLENVSDDFSFEYAIDQHIVSLTKEEFIEKKKSPENKVDLITLLDDSEFIPEGEEKSIEFAFRLHNCGEECHFLLTHVYWA